MQCTEEHYQALTPVAGWTYNYRMFPFQRFPLSWAEENNVEFVAMLPHTRVKFSDGSECEMREDNCDISKIVDELENTKEQVHVEYLMAFNEPY